MYCVKCGVKLQDGVKKCPLCNTPVMCEDNFEVIHQTYSTLYPKEDSHAKYTRLSLITCILIAAELFILIFCLNYYGTLSWGGIAMLSMAAFYVMFVLPFWFKKRNPYIFIPVSFGAIEGLLLYIDLYLGGKWFLSFAFPVVLICLAVVLTFYTLFKNIKKCRLLLSGILLIAIGGYLILIELFESITFGTEMWTWSLYCIGALAPFGIFIFVASFIKPLRGFLERSFFI